jgi:tRNA threonylcarbamoyladenosine biosynthesis protein TsaE
MGERGMSDTRVIVTGSDIETERVARELGERAVPGLRLHLFGELGAGKTAFVRGLAEGLGVDPDAVSSPTFALVQEYRGRLPLVHVDLYRLSPAEVPDLGLESLATDGVLAVEWAERLPAPDPGAVAVRIEDLGGDSRRITIN